MNKQSRLFAIRQIINSRPVSSQEELRLLLEEQGIESTQTTLSRDMKELGVARVHTPSGTRYALDAATEQNRLARLIGYEIESIHHNESIVVVKTLPGRAQGVAEIIDRLRIEGVMGTLAGDNTVFIAPASVKQTARLASDLQRIVIDAQREEERMIGEG